MKITSNVHSINVDVACDVGVTCADVYEIVRKEVELNINEDENFHDGFHWIKTTPHELAEKMPYFNYQKIARSLRKLEDRGYLKTANYNKMPFDKTKWYACPNF